jgi:hypothetical protein
MSVLSTRLSAHCRCRAACVMDTAAQHEVCGAQLDCLPRHLPDCKAGDGVAVAVQGAARAGQQRQRGRPATRRCRQRGWKVRHSSFHRPIVPYLLSMRAGSSGQGLCQQ